MSHTPEVTPEQKRAVYSSVHDEIVRRNEQGEIHYAQGYYAAAVEDFEAVNFYEGRAVISLNRIKRISEKAEERSKYYYARGMRALESDKRQSLIEFNRMIHCNPKYKDGKVQYEKLKKEKEIAAFLATLETDINSKLKKNLQSTSALKLLNQSIEALAQYDDSNVVVIKAQETLASERKTQLNKAIALFDNQKYDDASEKFEAILQIYPNEPTAQRYLDQLAAKQEVQKRVKLARSAMEQQDYRLAMKYASKVLEMDSGNSEGKNILDVATKKYQQSIPKLVAKGIEYYNKQQMENALTVFQSVLEVDSNNTTSIVYMKKIKRQLDTIKRLK
jgi:tetratricopeptide (TPR) repeat protein